MKVISYKMEMQIAVLKASVQEPLKHQLSARGQIGRIKIFLLNSSKSAARSDVDALGFHC